MTTTHSGHIWLDESVGIDSRLSNVIAYDHFPLDLAGELVEKQAEVLLVPAIPAFARIIPDYLQRIRNPGRGLIRANGHKVQALEGYLPVSSLNHHKPPKSPYHDETPYSNLHGKTFSNREMKYQFDKLREGFSKRMQQSIEYIGINPQDKDIEAMLYDIRTELGLTAREYRPGPRAYTNKQAVQKLGTYLARFSANMYLHRAAGKRAIAILHPFEKQAFEELQEKSAQITTNKVA